MTQAKSIEVQTQLQWLKSTFQCPISTPTQPLLAEFGLRPMRYWLQQRMLEYWMHVQALPHSRLPKQVAQAVWHQSGAGRYPRTWAQAVADTFREVGLNEGTMVQMNKKEFKKAVRNAVKTHGQAVFDAECLTQSSASGARNLYASHVNSVVQYSQAQHYLNVGACTKGKLLLLQLRTGSLPVRGNVHVLLQHGAPTACPACQHDDETTKHFLVECATTQSARANMLNKLQQTDPDLAQRLPLDDTDAL